MIPKEHELYRPVLEAWRRAGRIETDGVRVVYAEQLAKWEEHRSEYLAQRDRDREEAAQQQEIERESYFRWHKAVADREAAERAARAEAAEAHRLRRKEINEKYQSTYWANVAKTCRLFPTPAARLLWLMDRRQEGMTYTAIAKMIGISPARANQIGQKAERLVRQNQKRIHTVAARSRPIDMGGPRDVWLEFYPPPDPRFDNMAPVVADFS